MSLKRGYRFRVARWMTPIFLEACPQIISASDLIVPVPLSRKRLRKRRFNQASLLALHLSQASGVPHNPDALVRVRDTSTQSSYNHDQRYINVCGSFSVAQPNAIQDRQILLLDDVMTTGATANVCAKALLDAGAQDVRVLTIARRFSYKEAPPRLLSHADRHQLLKAWNL